MSVAFLDGAWGSVRAIMDLGGPVMWPLAAASVWAWTLILRKGWQLARWRGLEARVPTTDILQGLAEGRLPHGAGSRDWRPHMANAYLARRTGDADLDRMLLHRLCLPLLRQAHQGLGAILMLAELAPFMGLLGTVTGMIGAFDSLATVGSGASRTLSGGIAAALVSTQTGLLVAIPALFAGHFLKRRAQGFEDKVRRFQSRLGRLECAPGAEA
ncbi:MAG: MotA/TolQ/ExbB proton channel family protein [Desulfovibrionaceae bacterium]